MKKNIGKIVEEVINLISQTYKKSDLIGLAELFMGSICIDGRLQDDANLLTHAKAFRAIAGGISTLRAHFRSLYNDLLSSGYLRGTELVIHTHCLALTYLGIRGDDQIDFIQEMAAELRAAGVTVHISEYGSAP